MGSVTVGLVRLLHLCLLSALLSAVPLSARAELQFHWQDAFSAEEKSGLTAWITETQEALESLVGTPPFEVHIFFHRIDGAREPVPWAHTERSDIQGVHFHVDPRFPMSDFRRDWTAPHELSHLVLPYLGSKHAWFAEGFASYMQYQVMGVMGELTAAQVARSYQRKLQRSEQNYGYPDSPFAAAAKRLRAERKYPVMYWGGAAYFLRVGQELDQSPGQGLIATLKSYLTCCRQDEDDLQALLAELDRLAGSDAFNRNLQRFRSVPGFPVFADLF